ncbi:ankyrin repeat-containing domain protein [Mycena olivaceomarginata]|nr:ankyrin repeat-containing domain protein [Mycena olivaceomarginata]
MGKPTHFLQLLWSFPLYVGTPPKLTPIGPIMYWNQLDPMGLGKGLTEVILQWFEIRVIGWGNVYGECLPVAANLKPRVNAGGNYGTAVQAASYEGHRETVALLLAKGADPNAQGGEYGTALQAASYGGHTKTVALLLDKGADPKAQGGKYGTALQAASYEGHMGTGADPNAQGGIYGTALQAASYRGHMKTIALHLDKGADPKAQGGGVWDSTPSSIRWWTYGNCYTAS